MPRIGRLAFLAVALFAATVALAGCTKQLKVDDAENKIRDQLNKQGQQIRTVDCPDDIEATKGTTATCTVTATDGRTGKGTLTVVSDDADFTFTLR